MARARRNHSRENRIREEIIVDAYGPEEQAMGWYYYLEDKIQFPFHAQCIASVPTSPLRKGDSVEIRKMAPKDSCSTDMLVMIRWKNRNIAVPLSQMKAIDVDESTTQVIEDWRYWISQGNFFRHTHACRKLTELLTQASYAMRRHATLMTGAIG